MSAMASDDSEFNSIEATLGKASTSPSAYGLELETANRKLTHLFPGHGREASFLRAQARVYIGLGQWTNAYEDLEKPEGH
jgi:hypothetical protein